MKLKATILIIALLSLSCQMCSFANESSVSNTPYFVDNDINGLSLNEQGKLICGDSVINISTPPEDKIRAAVVHETDNTLTVVTDKATVVYYQLSGSNTSEIIRYTQKLEAQLRTVRFSHVSGLVYLLWDDVKRRKELQQEVIQSQDYSDRYCRVALVKSAEKWHAIPANNPKENMLGIAYYVNEMKIVMEDSGEHATTLELNEPLGSPYRSGPGDSLAQSVFLFPSEGIVCRTVDGWSLHQPNGKLVRTFSTKEVYAGWWADPFVKNGHFYVYARTGPGGNAYLLDIKTGELIKNTDSR